MEENEIERLFLSVAEQSAEKTEAIREVFSALVKSTLKYRDHMLAAKGVTVTVEDVRTALSWLVPTLRTGRYPETDNKLRLDLLKIWVAELRTLGHPHVYLS